MKRIALIGSTGSIGRQVIAVCNAHKDRFQVVAMAANRLSPLFLQQVEAVKPAYCALVSPTAPVPKNIAVGEQAALSLCSLSEVDVVVVACSGFSGLKYSLAALKAGKRLALANKESLVCGGDLVMPLVQDNLVPVDSEHSALWQCLHFHLGAPYQKLILTASGGAFRGKKWDELKAVTPEQALAHPTWQMGPKITVDSATLLNKGYEVIEAHHLYNAPYDRIQTVIQPQSIVHSMVEFADGAILAQMSNPTMELPIQLALTYPDRLTTSVTPMDFSQAFSLAFLPLIRKDYPCYDLALTCGEAGGIAPTVLNAAAEVAVEAFLQKKLAYTDIYTVTDKCVQATPNKKVTDYPTLAQADCEARRLANKLIVELA